MKMTRFQRLLAAAAGSVLGIPLLTVAFAPLMMILLEPEPVSVSPQDLPPQFPVLGVWRDSTGSHCRAYTYRELEVGESQLPSVSLSVSGDDRVACSRSFEAFNATGQWPDSPPWADAAPGHRGLAHFELQSLAPGNVEVHVSYGSDGEGPNVGLYEVRNDSTQLRNPRHQHYFGLAVGPGVIVVAAVLCSLAYAVIATAWVLLGRRRAAA